MQIEFGKITTGDVIKIILLVIAGTLAYSEIFGRINDIDNSVESLAGSVSKVSESIDSINNSIINIDKRLQTTENYIDFVIKKDEKNTTK